MADAFAGRSVGGRLEAFIDLSVALTGYGRLHLLGTGVAEEYLSTADAVLPAGVLDELLAAFARLPGGEDRESTLAGTILGDQRLGPVARNLIVLWYCGTWTQLPEAWRAAHGASQLDTNRVVSAAAYQAGLQWVAAGAHPAGARPHGFGSWALPPKGSGE